MNPTSIRRPLGCLKNALRNSRQQQQQQQHQQQQHQQQQQHRGYANAIFKDPQQIAPAPPTQMPRIYGVPNPIHRLQPDRPAHRTAFAVYTTPKTTMGSLRVTHPHLTRPHATPVLAHHAYQIRKMDPSGARTKLFAKDNPDAARVGDVLLVQAKRASEPFAGVLMCVRRRGVESAVLLRGQLSKVGVEMWFKIYSRNVTGIEIIKRAEKRARRAKLTYLRHPKHDVGSVDHLVRAWRRTRMANAAKSVAGKGKGKGKTKREKKSIF
ncbi:unnamed protein product [Discula destructiva]